MEERDTGGRNHGATCSRLLAASAENLTPGVYGSVALGACVRTWTAPRLHHAPR